MRTAIIVAVLFCAGLIGIGIYFSVPKEDLENRLVPLHQSYLDRQANGGWARGATQPLVVVEEYADLQCPGCAGMKPVLDEAMAQSSDYVQMVFKHFPLPQHNKARLAAQMAEAAGRQGYFWEVEAYLYSTLDQWEAKSVSAFKSQVASYVESLGINMDQYNSDLNSPSLNTEIDKDLAQGNAVPVTQTPSLIVNGENLQNLPRTTAEMIALFESVRSASAQPSELEN